MKKLYISPMLEIHELVYVASLMAGSEISVAVEEEDFDGDSMTSLSRKNDGKGIWDDDEEEE